MLLYYITIISYITIIISYTILSCSSYSSIPSFLPLLPILFLFISSLPPLPLLQIYLPFFLSFPYSHLPFPSSPLLPPILPSSPLPLLPIFLPSLPLFSLIHSILVGTYIYLFIFNHNLPIANQQSDPACFIGVDG